jgi:hypothetical protein
LDEAMERVGAALHHAETAAKVVDVACVAAQVVDSRQQAAGDGLDGRKRIRKLVSQHANQALPGGLFLFLKGNADIGQHQQSVGRSILPEDGFAQEPARG